jgi:hypothetical protein
MHPGVLEAGTLHNQPGHQGLLVEVSQGVCLHGAEEAQGLARGYTSSSKISSSFPSRLRLALILAFTEGVTTA